MIERKTLLSLPYYKKANFTGGDQYMRYRISRVEDPSTEKELLEACVWRGPFCYNDTKEEKIRERFSFSEEGLQEIVAWINEQEEKGDSYFKEASLFSAKVGEDSGTVQ